MLADFLEGVAAERDGRLECARTLLEQADPSSSAFEVNLVLGNVYLALGEHDRALDRLGLVAKSYDRIEQLGDRERFWILEFAPERPVLDLLLVRAHLGKASKLVVKHQRQQPGQSVPSGLIQRDEDAARALIAAMPRQSSRSRAARQALISFLAQTSRKEEAEQELAATRVDFPDSVELLQLDVAMTVATTTEQPLSLTKLDPAVRDQADQKIGQFHESNPASVPGKLFWANWLVQTGRGAQAVAYIEDPANFPSDRDNTYKHVLALALIATGEQSRGLGMLRHLPSTPEIDATIFRLAGSPEEQTKLAEESLERNDRNGTVRCISATAAFNRKDYVRAAQEFFRALEYTRVRTMAVQGLRVSLMLHAQREPSETLEVLSQMLNEAPKEESLYLVYASVSMQLDDIGSIDQAWERTRNMATALNTWEQLFLRDGGDPVTAALTRAELWLAANRNDLAWKEIQRALSYEPKDDRAVFAAAVVAATSGDMNIARQGRQHAAALRAAQPDSVMPILLEAGLLEVERKPNEARTLLESALDKFSNEQEVYSRIFLILLQSKDFERVQQHVARWRLKFPDSFAAESASVTLMALSESPETARERASRVQELQLKRIQTAQANTKRPTNVPEATWKLQQAQNLAKERRTIQLELSLAFQRAQNYDDAEAILKQCLNEQADDVVVLTLLANLHLLRQDWMAAQSVLKMILQKEPDNFVAGNNLADILATKLDQPAEAREIVDRLRLGRFSKKPLPGDRLNSAFLDTIGVVYHRIGGTDACQEMVSLFESARIRYPSDPRPYLYLGHAYAGLNQPATARNMYAAAIRLARQDRCHELNPQKREEVIDAAMIAQKLISQ
jgi:tetratricopeptide (TPR) repeat protein